MALTNNGYTIRQPQEIRDALVARITNTIPDFLLQPADVQSNIINTGIAGLLEYENLMAEVFNSFSASGKNMFLFRQLAESLGMQQRDEYKAQVMLEFSGKYGDFIPSQTKVESENGDIFITQENIIIPSTKTAQVLALGDTENISQANTITKIVSQLSDGISVTNPSASLAYIPSETDDEFVSRIQARLRSPRKGGIDYATSILQSVEGVDNRLIKFKIVNIITSEVSTRAVEAIIGGGSNENVGLALFLSFLETQKLLSNPSDSDESRTISIDVNVNNNIIPIKWTRPKLLQIELLLKITFQGKLVTPKELEGLLSKEVINYVNTLRVGTPLNKNSINLIILQILAKNNLEPYNIKNLDYEVKINNENTTFSEDTGFLQEVKDDCYLELVAFNVTINE